MWRLNLSRNQAPGQQQFKLRPHALNAVHADMPAVGAYGAVNNGQAQASTRQVHCIGGAVKALKQQGQIIRWYANAVVSHYDTQLRLT
jgi:hypothetical protein